MTADERTKRLISYVAAAISNFSEEHIEDVLARFHKTTHEAAHGEMVVVRWRNSDGSVGDPRLSVTTGDDPDEVDLVVSLSPGGFLSMIVPLRSAESLRLAERILDVATEAEAMVRLKA